MYPEYYKGVHGYEYRIEGTRTEKVTPLIQSRIEGQEGGAEKRSGCLCVWVPTSKSLIKGTQAQQQS
jgi:hypothetical protein